MDPYLEGLLAEVSGHPFEDVEPYLGEFARLLAEKVEEIDSERALIEVATEAWAAIRSCYDVDEQIEAERTHPGKVIQIRRGRSST